MDKNAIKKYAVWARTELIERVRQRALKYEVSADADANANADSASGKVLTDIEKTQRQAAIARVREKGYEYVIEEVAYTWFNRFAALRYMEVNNYLPTRVRVFTDENGAFKPQILTEAIHMNLDELDMEKVYALKEAENNDELYKYLLITRCNALSTVLPQMFKPVDERCKEEKNDYTILLFPDNQLRDGSVIEQMVTLIPEDNWLDAVQIIGWLYQYYNSEPKDKVFADLKKNIKITKENIPAATQLFTPDWIVRYMVENSLGRLWLEGHPNDELKSEWKYYLDEAQQEPEVEAQLAEIRKEYAALKPEDILCIDPCMGSGHILAYLFDTLMKIYAAYGYSTRESVQSIIEHNLYGLDIDDRAAQLAYFEVMMTAAKYDNRFLKRSEVPQPHVYAIKPSNAITADVVQYFAKGDKKLTADINTIIDEMHDADEYGSILNIMQVDFGALYQRFDEVQDDISFYRNAVLDELLPVVRVAEILAQKYDVVVTNPPYMSNRSMGDALLHYIQKIYPDEKADLFAVFIERCSQMAAQKGYQAMITQHSWMFLSSFEKLREKLFMLETANMAHLGARAFEEIGGEVVQTTSFVFWNIKIDKYKGVYCRLVEPTSQDGKEQMFLSGINRYEVSQDNFEYIEGRPIAYWASARALSNFRNANPLIEYSRPRVGQNTGDNERFLRIWFEIENEKIGYGITHDELATCPQKWIPYNKGGSFRRWYGNFDRVVNWANDGEEIKNYAVIRNHGKHWSRYIQNIENMCREGISWSDIASTRFGCRYLPEGFICDVKGSSTYPEIKYRSYIMAFLNSHVAIYYLQMLNPTTTFQVGNIGSLPFIFDREDEIENLAEKNVSLSKADWDSVETSWDFIRHPIVPSARLKRDQMESQFKSDRMEKFGRISWHFDNWERDCDERFNQLKANEEELNRIFIDIYGLQDELTPEVEDKDVTVRKADLLRDIKSFISYAVGCMFGRYSLDIDGLAYAGGEWDASKYQIFPADKDNIIPICDDEYFEDDITGLFVKFVEKVYGKETLDANLKFIADALGGKGTPKEVIRNYFLNDFFSDHCNMYSVTGSGKRPIYWLFDSGKKNGFKALVYMHRYQTDTIARMRTDYVHEQQSRYRTAITDLENRIADASTSERVRLNKQLSKLRDQSEEIRKYEEKIHHLADQYIAIDLDDGVKVNYAKLQDVLAKIK